MGNVLPLPCMSMEARVMVQATAAGAKKTKRIKLPAVARNVVMQEDQHGSEEKAVKKNAPWPGCPVQELAAAEECGVRLKVVMTRKDALEFLARLEERTDAERKAGMGKLGGGNGVMSPCCGAWTPGLATIPEN